MPQRDFEQSGLARLGLPQQLTIKGVPEQILCDISRPIGTFEMTARREIDRGGGRRLDACWVACFEYWISGRPLLLRRFRPPTAVSRGRPAGRPAVRAFNGRRNRRKVGAAAACGPPPPETPEPARRKLVACIS